MAREGRAGPTEEGADWGSNQDLLAMMLEVTLEINHVLIFSINTHLSAYLLCMFLMIIVCSRYIYNKTFLRYLTEQDSNF